MPNAIESLRVVDFGQYIAGPLLGMLLADQGVQVTRVDPPSGPLWDTPANQTWNRGKRRIALDLKAEADLEVARRLIASADIVIENFRPGVMDRLGLGAEASMAANPTLIYCSLPGFSSDDPRAATPAWEGVVGAATGTYHSGLDGQAGPRPVYTAIPIASGYSAFLGAASIAAALVARDRDGIGQRIEVPLFDATFTAIGLRGQRFLDQPLVRRGGSGWVRQYECKDGRWVQFHAANTRFVEQFVDAAGVGHWRDDGLVDRQNFVDDPSLEGELIRRMTELFLTRPALEWEDLVNAAGTPTAICRESAEWLDHPHPRTAGAIVELDDPELGHVTQPGVTPRRESLATLHPNPAHLENQDADDIRAESLALSGAGAAPSGAPSSAGPLAGIKVIDLCIILAGPTCGRTLAELGADVIKIDSPGREGGIAFHHDVNRGKKSLLLDLKEPDGMEVFWRLLEDADVVVQNYRAGVVDRLGIGYEAVKARRPDIVYASLNAYGHGGPWETRPGWEQLAQAATGMQARYGGERPVLQPFPVNDYATGVLGAYGVLLALNERTRTGKGQQVHSALAYTAATLQSAFLMDYEGKTWDEPRGQDALGASPLHRLYQASDGWFFLGAAKRDLPALTTIAGVEGEGAAHALDSALEQRFVSGTIQQWVEKLSAAGIGAYPSLSVEQVMEDPWAVAQGLSLTREHDGVGRVRKNGPGRRLHRTPETPGAPASLPGADAHEVFTEYGIADRLDALVQKGILAIEESTGGN